MTTLREDCMQYDIVDIDAVNEQIGETIMIVAQAKEQGGKAKEAPHRYLLETKTYNSYINDEVVNVFMKTIRNTNIIAVPSQFFLQLQDAGSWANYINDCGQYANTMANWGMLHGYQKLMNDLENMKIIAIIPINFDKHWTVVVMQYSGWQWILQHADSLSDDGGRA